MGGYAGNAAGDITGENHEFIRRLIDLPPVIGGIITLVPGRTYAIMANLDLEGARLVPGDSTLIIGQSSENTSIISTGLVGQPLITCTGTFPLRDIQITANIAFALLNNTSENVFIRQVRFTDCGVVGTIADYANVIIDNCTFENCGPLTFDGEFDTVAFSQCLIQPAAGQSGIVLTPTCLITRRFRLIYSAVIAQATSNGITAIPTNFDNFESFILDVVNFSGEGTYLTGISQSDNEASFHRNIGIVNSADLSQYYMVNNIVETTLTDQGTFYKIEGATLDGPHVEKFVNSDNRATYVGALNAHFDVIAVVSFTGQAGNAHAVRLAEGDAVTPATTIPFTEQKVTAPAGGKIEGLTVIGTVQWFELNNPFIELWIANLDSPGRIAIVEDLNVSIKAVA